MPRSHYSFFETENPYFVNCTIIKTGTIVGWLPVFTRPEAADIVYDSRRYFLW